MKDFVDLLSCDDCYCDVIIFIFCCLLFFKIYGLV